MWNRIGGKSNKATDPLSTSSTRHKSEGEQERSRQRSVSLASTDPKKNTSQRSNELDRISNTVSTRYSSTGQTPYQGVATSSAAPSYVAVSGDHHGYQKKSPGLVRNPSLVDTMGKPRSSRGGLDGSQDGAMRSDSGTLDMMKEPFSKREGNANNNNTMERREREDTEKRTDSQIKKDRRRKGSESSKQRTRIEEVTSKVPQDFSSQFESNSFVQYPERYNTARVEPSTGPQGDPVPLSSHIENQFPGQFPTESSMPYKPPVGAGGGGLGLAAEYYGDTGESVAEQPGFRKHSPSLIVGAEPHLQPASLVAAPPLEPSQLGGTGAAASFYNGELEESYSSSAHQHPSVHTSAPGRPSNNYSSSSAPVVPTLGGAVATGYTMSGGLSLQQQEPNHGSTTSTHYGDFSSLANKPPVSHVYEPGHTSSVRPPKPSEPSQSSHAAIYSAGVAGAAGLAAAAYSHSHQQHAQHGLAAQQQLFSPTQRRRPHQGPLDTLVNFFIDPEGVAQYEEYTEFIGVCRGCFEPGSSSRDAPRKHRYSKTRSKDRLSRNTRIDKQHRYSSSDDEHRNKRNVSWLGAGLAGYGLEKVGETLFNQRNDFDDTYDVRSGRFSPSENAQAIRRSSENKSRRNDRSEERAEADITINGKIYTKASRSGVAVQSDPTKYTSRRWPRSRSKDHKATAADVRIDSKIPLSESQQRSNPPLQASNRNGRISRDKSPIQHLKKHKKKKQTSFFSFLSASSSSSSLDLSSRSEKRKRKKRRSSLDKIKNDQEAEAALLGLGAATAALAFKDGRSKSKISKEVQPANRKPNRLHQKSKRIRSERSPISSEEVWESASDGLIGAVDSDLAFGSPSRQSSVESLSSRSSGTDKWDWRWGTRERRQDFPKRMMSAPNDSEVRNSTTATSLAGATMPSSDQYDAPANDSTSKVPLQNVYPIPTSDPGRFDARAEDPATSSSQPMIVSRPEATPIQQPQPLTPVSSTFYNPRNAASLSNQAPAFSHPSYHAQPNGDRSGSMTSVSRVSPRHVSVAEVGTEAIRLQRRETSPARLEQDGVSSARYPQRTSSSKVGTSSVRFAVSPEQDDQVKNENHRKRSEKYQRDSPNESQRKSSSEKQSREHNAVREPQIDIEYDKNISWAVPAIGAAGAAVGAAVIAGKPNQKETREERRERRRREREREDEEEALIRSERRRRKEREHKSAPGSSHNRQQDGSEVEVTLERDQESAIEVSPRKKSIWQEAATAKQTAHEDYQSFFAPTDILNKDNDQMKVTGADPNADINLIEIAPKMRPPDEPEYSQADTDEHIDLSAVSLSWPVPRLKLIQPTPPASRVSTPFFETTLASQQDVEGVDKTHSSSKFSWGDDQSHEYHDIASSEPHDDLHSSSPEKVGHYAPIGEHSDPELNDRPSVVNAGKSQPFSNRPTLPEASQSHKDDHEFAAVLAAGAQEAGFDPSIVIDNPTYRQRESPPGSEDQATHFSFEEEDESYGEKKNMEIFHKAAENQESELPKEPNASTVVEEIVRQVEQSSPFDDEIAGDNSRSSNTVDNPRRSSNEQRQGQSAPALGEIEANISTFSTPPKEAARDNWTDELVRDQETNKKSQKTSKAQISRASDTASTVSPTATVSAEKNAESIGGKDSLWNQTLGNSIDDLSQINRVDDETNGAFMETLRERETSNRRPIDRQALSDLNDDAVSTQSLQRNPSGRDEKRQIIGVNDLPNVGWTTRDPFLKGKEISVDEATSNTSAIVPSHESSPDEAENVDEHRSESFLETRPEPPPPPDIDSTHEEPPGQVHLGREASAEHTKRRSSEILIAEPKRSPRSTSSPTAVPLNFRRPQSSPGLKRSASICLRSPAQNEADMYSKPKPRPRSVEFRSSKDIRPLRLVERHQSFQRPPPGEAYPPLPDSRSTSAASSIQDIEEIRPALGGQEISERDNSPQDLVEAVPEGTQADVHGSQQNIPTAASFERQTNRVRSESSPIRELLSSPTTKIEPSSQPPHVEGVIAGALISGAAASALSRASSQSKLVGEELSSAENDQSQAVEKRESPSILNYNPPEQQPETFEQTEERHLSKEKREDFTPVEEKGTIALEAILPETEPTQQLIGNVKAAETAMQDTKQDERTSLTKNALRSNKLGADIPQNNEITAASLTIESQHDDLQFHPMQAQSADAEKNLFAPTSVKNVKFNDPFVADNNFQNGQRSHEAEIKKDAAETADPKSYIVTDMHELSPLTTPLPDSDDSDLFEALHTEDSLKDEECQNAHERSEDGHDLVRIDQKHSQIQPAAKAYINQDRDMRDGTKVLTPNTEDEINENFLAEDGKSQSDEVNETFIASKPTEDAKPCDTQYTSRDSGDIADTHPSKDEGKALKSGSDGEVHAPFLREPPEPLITGNTNGELAIVIPQVPIIVPQDSLEDDHDAPSEEQSMLITHRDTSVSSDPTLLSNHGEEAHQSIATDASEREDDTQNTVHATQDQDNSTAPKKEEMILKQDENSSFNRGIEGRDVGDPNLEETISEYAGTPDAPETYNDQSSGENHHSILLDDLHSVEPNSNMREDINQVDSLDLSRQTSVKSSAIINDVPNAADSEVIEPSKPPKHHSLKPDAKKISELDKNRQILGLSEKHKDGKNSEKPEISELERENLFLLEKTDSPPYEPESVTSLADVTHHNDFQLLDGQSASLQSNEDDNKGIESNLTDFGTVESQVEGGIGVLDPSDAPTTSEVQGHEGASEAAQAAEADLKAVPDIIASSVSSKAKKKKKRSKTLNIDPTDSKDGFSLAIEPSITDTVVGAESNDTCSQELSDVVTPAESREAEVGSSLASKSKKDKIRKEHPAIFEPHPVKKKTEDSAAREFSIIDVDPNSGLTSEDFKAPSDSVTLDANHQIDSDDQVTPIKESSNKNAKKSSDIADLRSSADEAEAKPMEDLSRIKCSTSPRPADANIVEPLKVDALDRGLEVEARDEAAPSESKEEGKDVEEARNATTDDISAPSPEASILEMKEGTHLITEAPQDDGSIEIESRNDSIDASQIDSPVERELTKRKSKKDKKRAKKAKASVHDEDGATIRQNENDEGNSASANHDSTHKDQKDLGSISFYENQDVVQEPSPSPDDFHTRKTSKSKKEKKKTKKTKFVSRDEAEPSAADDNNAIDTSHKAPRTDEGLAADNNGAIEISQVPALIEYSEGDGEKTIKSPQEALYLDKPAETAEEKTLDLSQEAPAENEISKGADDKTFSSSQDSPISFKSVEGSVDKVVDSSREAPALEELSKGDDEKAVEAFQEGSVVCELPISSDNKIIDTLANGPRFGDSAAANENIKDSLQNALDLRHRTETCEAELRDIQSGNVLNENHESRIEEQERIHDGDNGGLDSGGVIKAQGVGSKESLSLGDLQVDSKDQLDHDLESFKDADGSDNRTMELASQDTIAPEQLPQGKENLESETQDAEMRFTRSTHDDPEPSFNMKKGKKDKKDKKDKKKNKKAKATKSDFQAEPEEAAKIVSYHPSEETNPGLMGTRDEDTVHLIARSEESDETPIQNDAAAETDIMHVRDFEDETLGKKRDGEQAKFSQKREREFAPVSQPIRSTIDEPQEQHGHPTTIFNEDKHISPNETSLEMTQGTQSHQQEEASGSAAREDGESMTAKMEAITEDVIISQAAELGEIKDTESNSKVPAKKDDGNEKDGKSEEIPTKGGGTVEDYLYDSKHTESPLIETPLSARSIELLDADAQRDYDEKYARELQRNLGLYADKAAVTGQYNDSTSFASGNTDTEQPQEPRETLASIAPLEDIIEEPRSRSGSIQEAGAPKNDMTSMVTKKPKNGKKGKKGKKQKQIVIWEDDTATPELAQSAKAPLEQVSSDSKPLDLEEYIEPDCSHKEVELPVVGSPSLQRSLTRGDDESADYFGIQPTQRAEMNVGNGEGNHELSASHGPPESSHEDGQANKAGEQPSDNSWDSPPIEKTERGLKKIKTSDSGQGANAPSPDRPETQSPYHQEVDEASLVVTPTISRDSLTNRKESTNTGEILAGATLGQAAVATEKLSRKKSEKSKRRDGSRSKSTAPVHEEPADLRTPEASVQQSFSHEEPHHHSDQLPENLHVTSSPSGDISENYLEQANMKEGQDSNWTRDSANHFDDSLVIDNSRPLNRAGQDSRYPDVDNGPLVDENKESQEGLDEREIIDSYVEQPERQSTFTENDIIESYQIRSHDEIALPSPEHEGSRSPVSPKESVEIIDRIPTPDEKSERRKSRRSSGAGYDSDDSADSGFDAQKQRRQLQTVAGEQREPSPVASTSKDRSSVLFNSSPCGREEMVGQLPDQPKSSDYSTPDATRQQQVLGEHDERHPEPSWSFADASEVKSSIGKSLFGGPIRTDDSPPPTQSPPSINSHGQQSLKGESERDTKQSPQLPPVQNETSHTSARDSPDFGSHAEPKHSDHEDGHSTINRTADGVPNQQSKAKEPLSRQEGLRSPGVAAPDSIRAIIKTPDQVRSASGQSFRSSETPPLRRVDRSASGDLRAASRKSEAKLDASPKISEEAEPEPGPELDSESESLAEQPDVPPATSSTYDPLTDKGKKKADSDMADYEGWGDVRSQSPISPTRPPSMRKRQSLYFAEMEQRLAMLASENSLLQTARSKAEQRLEEQARDHSQQRESYDIAIREHKAYLAEKDSKLHELNKILDELRHQVAHLTTVNEELLQSREQEAQGQHDWEQTSRELEDLRLQHTKLASDHEDIVAREVDAIREEKETDLQNLKDELENAKEQVRKLQQQILTSSSIDDIVEHDEDYFDTQCQDLCKHLISWVKRFSKLSDNKRCYLAGEIRNEAYRELFEDSMLDGSEVDDYLQDRHKRRDVFMSVTMTLIFRHVFARYLFGMDREHRQKLKTLDKTLQEVGPPSAVHKWRATTLTLLSKRPAFQSQRDTDSEGVVGDIWATLSSALPPPTTSVQTAQCRESLRRVVNLAVDLSIDMRLQRAEYSMLPPPEPDFDPQTGDIRNRLYFTAASMNERSGVVASNEELEEQGAWLKMVLFPLVVKNTDEEEQIVVCPAQVHVAPMKKGKTVRVVSAQGERSEVSYDGGAEDTVMEGGMF